MRQALGPKKVARIARETGLPVVRALARGGTDHWLILVLEDGAEVSYHPRTGRLDTPRVRDWPTRAHAHLIRADVVTPP